MKLYIMDSDNKEVQRTAIEFAAIIGYKNYYLSFPFVEIGNAPANDVDVSISLNTELHESFLCEEIDHLSYQIKGDEQSIKDAALDFLQRYDTTIRHDNSDHIDQPIKKVYANDNIHKGLESLFDTGFLLKDNDGDFQADTCDVKIVHDHVFCDVQLISACNLAGRFSLDCLSYTYPIVSTNTKHHAIYFLDGTTTACEIHRIDEQIQIHIIGNTNQLLELTSTICESFPYMDEAYTYLDYTNDLKDSLQMKNLLGQVAYLKEYDKEEATCYFDNDIVKHKSYVETINEKADYHACSTHVKKYEEEFDMDWEVDRFKKMISTELYPKINKGDYIEIIGALSEDKDVRNEISYAIQKECESLGAMADVSIVCAYKQGFSWLEEVVLPHIKDRSDMASIKIKVKPFLPEGSDDWGDEAGAVPKRAAMDKDDPHHWFDLPIRYIQELYPIDDILASALQIDREQIEIEMYDGLDTYRVEVLDKDNTCIYQATYQAHCNERCYLDEFPELGVVHPATGYLMVRINGEEVLHERIITDMECIWDIYQTNVLPYFKRYIDTISNHQPKKEMQPFFAQMKLEIGLSDPDYKLASREDLFSPLNAMHEDLYFAGSDFFKTYGLKTAGTPFEAFGLIYPIITKRKGKPTFTFTHYDVASKEPKIVIDERVITGYKKPLHVYLKRIELDQSHHKQLLFEIEGDECYKDILKSYSEVFLTPIHQLEHFIDIAKVSWRIADTTYDVSLKPIKYKEKELLDINDIDLYEKELIGYDQYLMIIEKLKLVPQLYVYEVAKSFQGRSIYAIEFKRKEKGYCSRAKLINRFPTEYINARHHANEVSSTNAVFMLIKTLLTNEKYKDIQDKINFVFVPFENPDGAAIHYELQKEHPNWTFHIARYNAVGLEFAREYFKEDTIHKEAFAFTKTWNKWLPDIVVDNHGVPAHEWEQQFSGYTSPAFKGFWLPRAILYGYYWYIDEPEYQANKLLNKKIEDAIAERMMQDDEINKWNQDWKDRFEKYAHAWMPKLFPADYYKDMINYWIPYTYDEHHMYSSIRYPWITSCCYTSEVADETAQGEYLYLCARTHVLHDLALIDSLMKAKCAYRTSLSLTKDGCKHSCVRLRPVMLP